MTREQVVDAALELADQDGIDALTMPNLAQRLECGVMTLYSYVENKEELLDAIALRGLTDLRLPRPLPEATGAILTAWGRALRTTLLAHPSLPVIFLSQSVIGPGIFRGIEALLGALGRSGIEPRDGVQAIYAVLVYTTGFVAWELPRTHRRPPAAYAAEWRQRYAALDPDDFPMTGAVLDDLPLVASGAQFEVGLAAISAGLTGLKAT